MLLGPEHRFHVVTKNIMSLTNMVVDIYDDKIYFC
jgi:hypothetical protein